MLRGASDGRSTITALLGPTNTGKTHRAVERMLEHESGMIGLPLRLLAREVYDRITSRIGETSVALVTGEEKRVPPRPRYWICTVEAMPIDRDVDFLAIDEVQLAAHPERGHVFTDRILRARGRKETWLLGSDTMGPLVTELVPTAVLRSHPRLSELRVAETTGIGALPPRSAIVAFSATSVYDIAERVRIRRGGAAIVLGALSPRARNAQVAMYQAGEVDFMVATDAVGMGLNLDVGHVAFAELRKFDGREARELEPAELGQIAGRAGRYLNDGTFGTLSPRAPLSISLARSIETHDFAPVRRLYFRHHDLDTRSVDALLLSLKQPPPRRCLRPVERAEDHEALVSLVARPEIATRARGEESVSLLWQVCQVPDFRRLMLDDHATLLSDIFFQLSSPRQKLDPDWIKKRVDRLDEIAGDIDTLLSRMSFIRTWTYVAHQTGWVDDAATWQARARCIEDRLSDALHERLVQRFVDRGRATHKNGHARPRPRTNGRASTDAELRNATGDPSVSTYSSHPFSALLALRDRLSKGTQPIRAANLVDTIVDARHDQLKIDPDGRISFEDSHIGSLTRGRDVCHPDVVPTLEGTVGAGERSRITRRLLAFARDFVDHALAPLRRAPSSLLSAAGRGLLYQLEQSLGTIYVCDARDQIAMLTEADHQALKGAGVLVGKRVVFAPLLLKPAAIADRRALMMAWHGKGAHLPRPSPGAVSLACDARTPVAHYANVGYPVFGPRAIRADIAERVGAYLDERDHRDASRAERLARDRILAARLGCRLRDVCPIAALLSPNVAFEELSAATSLAR